MTKSRQQSQGMCRACGYVGTKATMTKHQATCAERQPSASPTHEVYRFRVSGAYFPAYWLDVAVTTQPHWTTLTASCGASGWNAAGT